MKRFEIEATHRRTCVLQLAMISFAPFCDFNCAPFSHPNQEQLVISGREKMTCTCNRACAMKSVKFKSSFLKSTIYMDYAVDIMFLKCSCCCVESQRAFTVACVVP